MLVESLVLRPLRSHPYFRRRLLIDGSSHDVATRVDGDCDRGLEVRVLGSTRFLLDDLWYAHALPSPGPTETCSLLTQRRRSSTHRDETRTLSTPVMRPE